MPCNTCLKINPIPECLADGEELKLYGLTVEDNNDVFLVMLKDVATGRTEQADFSKSGSTEIIIDLTSLMPLMNHPYEIRLLNESMEVILFTLTNPDSSAETGCCLEFNIEKSLVWDGRNLNLSSKMCEA